jgi:hypothetical protein
VRAIRGSCRQESAPRSQAEVWSQRPVRDTESLKPYGEHLKDLDADLVKVAPSINNFATRNLGFLV